MNIMLFTVSLLLWCLPLQAPKKSLLPSWKSLGKRMIQVIMLHTIWCQTEKLRTAIKQIEHANRILSSSTRTSINFAVCRQKYFCSLAKCFDYGLLCQVVFGVEFVTKLADTIAQLVSSNSAFIKYWTVLLCLCPYESPRFHVIFDYLWRIR